MITLTGKILAFAPVAVSFLLSDKTLASFGGILVGGMVFWIPYWLAWWLSDGFIAYYQANDNDPSSYRQRQDETANKYGDQFDASRAHREALVHRFYEVDRSCQPSNDVGFRTGPQGYGFYGGPTRLDL